MTLRKREAELLGRSAVDPPSWLREKGPFADSGECLEYLHRSVADPCVYWDEIGRTLPWARQPQGPSALGRWYPGSLVHAGTALAPGLAKSPELEAGVHRVALALSRGRLSPGTRVGLDLSGREILPGVIAGLQLGFVPVPFGPRLPDAELGRLCRLAGCGAVLTRRDEGAVKAPVVRPMPASGETGEIPKGAEVAGDAPGLTMISAAGRICTLPVAGLFAQSLSARRYLLPDVDGTLWVMGATHRLELITGVLGSLLHGDAARILGDQHISFADLAEELGSLRPAVLLADDATLTRLCDESQGEKLVPAPALVVVASDSLPASCYERITALFPGAHITQVIGSEEAGGLIAGVCPGSLPVHPGSPGPALPGVDLTILDRRGRYTPPSVGGLFGLQKPLPGVALELAEERFPLALEAKARLDREGYLWPMGPARVARESHGASTAAIEAILAQLAGVDQVAAVEYVSAGVRRITVYVVPDRRAGLADEALRKEITEACGELGAPEEIRIVDALPHSRSGKLMRSVLRRVSSGEPLSAEDAGLLTDPRVVEKLEGDQGGGRSDP